MPQVVLEPTENESTGKDFDIATSLTCTVSSGSGEVRINGESTPRKFGRGAGEIKEQGFGGVTKISIKGTGGQNKFRIDF